jgi:DNA-binding GntR family transcriptional regulator
LAYQVAFTANSGLFFGRQVVLDARAMPKRRRVFEPKIDRTPPNLQKLVRLIFSEAYLPGDRLVERDLAAKLQLSRIPVREGLQKLVSKGILLKDAVNRGLRLRDYGPAEITHLHEYREAIELAAARAACHNRNATTLVQLELICDEMEREAPNAPSARWLELDWQFHQTMVEASDNERFINDFDLLMLECNYVFYRLPDTMIPAKSRDHPLLATLVHGVIEAHRQITKLIAARDTNGVVDAMRLHLAGLSNRVHRDVVRSQFARASVP